MDILFIILYFIFADAELEKFIQEIVTANNRGVSAVGNVSSEPNWSFGQSLFFAGTVLTTIGMLQCFQCYLFRVKLFRVMFIGIRDYLRKKVESQPEHKHLSHGCSMFTNICKH